MSDELRVACKVLGLCNKAKELGFDLVLIEDGEPLFNIVGEDGCWGFKTLDGVSGFLAREVANRRNES